MLGYLMEPVQEVKFTTEGVLCKARTLSRDLLNSCTHMGGCQNYGPFLGPQFHTAPII